jgi:ABC-type branched-subunit amino acid transport system ATPase component
MAPLLSLESATKQFGGLIANREVSLTIEPGEIVGLIGPNGAGKTTLFNWHHRLRTSRRGPHSLRGHRRHPHAPRAHLSSREAHPAGGARLQAAALDNVVCGALQRTNP